MSNILVICSDQHHPRIAGYLGHDLVKTPHLDALAAGGTYFDRAYCNSPVCTPSRMSFITGKYVHQIDNWMIGVPLPPAEMTWARRLDQAGIPSTMLGKMDFCGEYQDGGFTDHRIIHRREAWDELPRHEPWDARLDGYTRADKRMHLVNAGPRPSHSMVETTGKWDSYDHDRVITDWALEYLESADTGPWALYLGYLMPHWPFSVPEEFYNMYYPDNIHLPHDANFPNDTLHPALRHFQKALDLGEVSEDMLRRVLAAYYGMVTCLDSMIGEVLSLMRRRGLLEDTHIIYTSDHGESLGEHGLFYKQCSYEGSVGVPVIVSGPGIPGNQRIHDPVSLVDMYPTIMDMAGLETEPNRPGESWLKLARDGSRTKDYAFAEFHGNFLRHDWFMLVRGDYKYTFYEKERSSLFHLPSDPQELNDLAGNPEYGSVISEFEILLRSICDPSEVSDRAKRDLGLIGPDGHDFTEDVTGP
jgi:choline-sulfatase